MSEAGDATDVSDATPVEVPPGFKIGRWEVGRRLGHGGWGSVYEGRALTGGAPDVAALKFLAPERVTPGRMSQLSGVVERELRFAEVAEQDGLIRTFELLTVSSAEQPSLAGAHVLVMERARASLRELIAEAGEEPVAGAGRIVRELWDALRGLHERGWVHGDVKPANVLLLDDDAVRLADFGLAAELDGTHAYAPHAASLDFVGPEWWSERVSEEGSRVRTSRDLWALGIVAHMTLGGGRYPFEGQTARARALRAQAYARGNDRLRLDRRVPAAWAEIIEDLLQPVPGERARRAGGLAQRMADADGLAAPPRRLRWRRSVAAGAVGLVAACAGGVMLAGGGSQGDPAIGGELSAGAAVPTALREPIEKAAHACPGEEVTPALIAGMLQAESGFDAAKRSDDTGEYGIALWTPRVFAQWSRDADGGGASVFSARDSIAALGGYLCAIRPRVAAAEGDRGLLLAAAYRVGSSRVRAARGVPEEARSYIREVADNARRFSRRAD